MRLKEFDIFRNIWLALKDFFKEDGLDKSSILAYYSIFSSLFLLTFFTFLFTRFLGDPGITLKSIYPFSPDFFSKVSPEIFKKAGEISTKLKEVGVVGIILSLFLGFLVIKKIVQFVNSMFYIDLREKRSEKDFLVRRISEFSLLFIMGLLVIITFFITGLIPILTALFLKNKFIAPHINPSFVDSLNNFLVLYVVPFLVTFLFFFVLYKWIPEKIVYVKGAFIAAIICAVLWELVKRAYAYYMVNISIFGRIKGPIIAIILFGFWMELSMGIMLYGAKLTYIFDKRKNDKLENDQSTG
jgi:YihY family inner membrane protein